MIADKILKVMTKIGPIIKDKKNEEKGFDYASLANIIIKAREAMIEEKIIIIPIKLDQLVQRSNDVIISMIYRFYDTEPNDKGQNEYFDINIPGQGCDSNGWAIYKALSGAYKYAITQTFAIPTIDDAESPSEINEFNSNENVALQDGVLNENKIESILGEGTANDFANIFNLNNIE